MRSADKGHEGYANYETWLVCLWIDNDEPIYTAWRRVATRVQDDGELAELLKHEFEHQVDILNVADGFWTDLIRSAISNVDWLEVAKTRRKT